MAACDASSELKKIEDLAIENADRIFLKHLLGFDYSPDLNCPSSKEA
jgi:hypothetical protein